jgi:hypothetical protein
MIFRRLLIPVALLVIGPVVESCYFLACNATPSPGSAPVSIEDGFSTELKVRPEKAKLYIASLRFQRSDLAARSLDSDLPEALISLHVAVVDVRGAVRFERDIPVGGRTNFSALDREWELGVFNLTTEPQTLRITIRHADASLIGLPAEFVVWGHYPKSCD